MILWAGRNNSDRDIALRDTDLMIRRQSAAVKRCLVLGILNSTGERGTDATYLGILTTTGWPQPATSTSSTSAAT